MSEEKPIHTCPNCGLILMAVGYPETYQSMILEEIKQPVKCLKCNWTGFIVYEITRKEQS